MYHGKNISVVIPCRNEEEGIKRVLKIIPEFIDEVLVMDNNSSDRTVENALAGGAHVIKNEKNLGYGGSFKKAFANVKGDIIVTCDGDGTYPIRYCHRLLDVLLEENFDFVSGRRFPLMNRNAMSFRNMIGNVVLTKIVNLFFGLKFQDALSGMWVFRREILPNFDLLSSGMSFSPEIKIEAFTNPNIRSREVPIIYGERIGKSKLYAWKDGFEILCFLLKKRFKKLTSVKTSVGGGIL